MLWKFWMIKGLWLEENKEILLFLIEIKIFFIYVKLNKLLNFSYINIIYM